ncbi:substrate-binding periplasmic protein [Magnetococcus sp. PR-3]|uniref:substrate-binding periplasmic protein n=1 Tax=Magnetococcus sp. PR-3 TaxID=3120355 RepID=UPI002FCDEC0B
MNYLRPFAVLLISAIVLFNSPATHAQSMAGDPKVWEQADHATVVEEAQSNQTLLVALPNTIFSSLRNGHPVGVISEATIHLLKKLGYQVKLIRMSPDAMKEALKEGSIDVGTSLPIPSSQEDHFLYSAPLIREYNVLMVRNGDSFTLNRRSDLYGKRIGARKNFLYPLLQDDPNITLIYHLKDGENARKLMLGELDAIIVGSVSDIFEFTAEGVMRELELTVMKTAVGFVEIGSAFSHNTFTQTQRDAFNQRLATFMQSPTWQRILERNGMRDLIHQWPLIQTETRLPPIGQEPEPYEP